MKLFSFVKDFGLGVRVICWIVLGMLMLLSASCVKLPYLVVYNNTGEDIEIVFSKGEKALGFGIEYKGSQ